MHVLITYLYKKLNGSFYVASSFSLKWMMLDMIVLIVYTCGVLYYSVHDYVNHV